MSAIETLKQKAKENAALQARLSQLALAHALDEELGQDVLREARVEFRSEGRVAVLSFKRHKEICVYHETGQDGVGWQLMYVVHQDSKPICITERFLDALRHAEFRD